MFLKLNRIIKEKEFEKIFKKGKGKYIESLGLKYLKNDLNLNRFAVVVSTKVNKKAVQRNRIKRQIKNILKNQKYSKKINYDIIILTFPPIKSKTFIEIEKDIIYLLKNQQLLEKQ
jgi:ribonuclease P protein component